VTHTEKLLAQTVFDIRLVVIDTDINMTKIANCSRKDIRDVIVVGKAISSSVLLGVCMEMCVFDNFEFLRTRDI
jgi:hypothetical protein